MSGERRVGPAARVAATTDAKGSARLSRGVRPQPPVDAQAPPRLPQAQTRQPPLGVPLPIGGSPGRGAVHNGGLFGDAPDTFLSPGLTPKGAVWGAAWAAPPVQPPPVQLARSPPKKVLKLTDDEILSLYESAQAEAAMESDWRGIQGPTPSREFSSDDGGGNAWSATYVSNVQADDNDCNQECLRILSRAMQEPGRSPRSFTAQILDPSNDTVCCQPHVEAKPDVVGNGKSWSCAAESW